MSIGELRYRGITESRAMRSRRSGERNSISVIARSCRLKSDLVGRNGSVRRADSRPRALVERARADRLRCKSYRFRFKAAKLNFARVSAGLIFRDVTQNLRWKARLFTSVHFANQRPSTSSFHYPVHLISRRVTVTGKRAADTLISRRYSPYSRRRQRTPSAEEENGRFAIN